MLETTRPCVCLSHRAVVDAGIVFKRDNSAHFVSGGAYYQDQRQMQMVFAVQPQAWLAQHPDMIVEPGAAEAAPARAEATMMKSVRI